MNLKILFLFLFIVSFISCEKKQILLESSESYVPKMGFDLQVFGKTHKGNLVGLEPYLTRYSYRTEETLFLTIKSYFDYARGQEILPVEKTVVVLPESIGNLLLLGGEDLAVFEKKTMPDAFKLLINNNLGRFIWLYLFSEHFSSEKSKETLYRIKAWQMAESYQIVFGRLAREYRVNIIAGSIVLPEPRVVEGKITIGDGPLENVSFYFHSDGTVDDHITRKRYLTEIESNFIFANNKNPNPIYQTPLGNLAIVIGQDSWHKDSYMSAKEQFADIIVIPSVFETQKEKLLWRKNLKVEKSSDAMINTSMIVFMRGKFWENNLSGEATLTHNEKLISIKKSFDATIGKIYVIGL